MLFYLSVNVNDNFCMLCFRMPAILNGEEEVRKWLDFGEVKSLDAMKLLQSKDILAFHPVSSLVNNSRNNSPECLQPVDLTSKKVSDLLWYFTDCGCKLSNIVASRVVLADKFGP